MIAAITWKYVNKIICGFFWLISFHSPMFNIHVCSFRQIGLQSQKSLPSLMILVKFRLTLSPFCWVGGDSESPVPSVLSPSHPNPTERTESQSSRLSGYPWGNALDTEYFKKPQLPMNNLSFLFLLYQQVRF